MTKPLISKKKSWTSSGVLDAIKNISFIFSSNDGDILSIRQINSLTFRCLLYGNSEDANDMGDKMQIHYFQRYHSKENVDTSNTMLMLSRLYNYNADKFFSMLNTLILMEDESPEISFDLQVAGDGSVADAVISQKSFKIVVETKLYNQFDKQQLTNHLKEFGAEDIKVLLTLDPKPMRQQLFDEMAAVLKNYNNENIKRLVHPIKHVNLTFEQLVEAMEDIIDDRDTEIVSVLDDFKKYCFDEKLIPDGYKWMRALVAGTTFQDNMDLSLFYDLESRKFSEHGYIGLYKDKSIRAIGKLKKTILAVEINGKMRYRNETGEAATPKEIDQIEEAIRRSEDYGYNLRTIEHRYFIVEKFYPINFRKTSKNPIQKSKFFNLADMFGYKTMPDTEKIAADLNGRSWEEF